MGIFVRVGTSRCWAPKPNNCQGSGLWIGAPELHWTAGVEKMRCPQRPHMAPVLMMMTNDHVGRGSDMYTCVSADHCFVRLINGNVLYKPSAEQMAGANPQ